LQKPVVFSEKDSRQTEKKVIMSGAVSVQPQWALHKKYIHQAAVPADIVFDQWVLDGKKQRMARYDPTSSRFGGLQTERKSRHQGLALPLFVLLAGGMRGDWAGLPSYLTVFYKT
jgi:hypothetical protein